MNNIPVIIQVVWGIIGLGIVAHLVAAASRGSRKTVSLTPAAVPPSRRRGVEIRREDLPPAPKSLEEIRARMAVAKGQERAALNDMALEIECNEPIDEQGLQDWLDSLKDTEPNVWGGN